MQISVGFLFFQLSANSLAGAFYAVQTLLSLASPRSSPSKDSSDQTASLCPSHQLIPSCSVHDAPRYSYRGMHVDISRNFQKKCEILQLLDLMASYKMNKFHFHLTDDEGWRLEIPGLEELTEVQDGLIDLLHSVYFLCYIFGLNYYLYLYIYIYIYI